MLSMYLFQQIRKLSGEGRSASAISRELRINRRTVAKYLAMNAPPKYKERKERTKPDPFAQFEASARQLLSSVEDMTAYELMVLLRKQGYSGSLRTTARRMALLRGEKKKERFFEQVYEPGEQCQFDFKEKVSLPFRDGELIVHLHFGTLPFSNAFFVKAFPFKNYEAFIDGVHSFFDYIGGQTENVRIDNLSPCVSKVGRGNSRTYTDAFKRAINYYGFGVLPCAPGKGSDKGDVERDIRTYAHRIQTYVRATGRIFSDFDDLNLFLTEFIAEETSEKAKDLLIQERSKLKPLPPRDVAVMCRVVETTVGPFGTATISKSCYSVPDQAIGRSCRVELGSYEAVVRDYVTKAVIARHPRKEDGDPSIDLAHVLPSLLRKPAAMVRWAHRDILFPIPAFKRFHKHLEKTMPDGANREFLRCVNLVQHASLQDIAAGLELLMREPVAEPFVTLKQLLGLNGPQNMTPLAQPPINPELSQYDMLIPSTEEMTG
jgi:transposase